MRLLLALAAIVACRSQPLVRGPNYPITTDNGAPSPEAAADSFLAAARASDFAALGRIWGSGESLLRDRSTRLEFEQRATIVACYVKYDTFRVLQAYPDTGHGVLLSVSLEKAGAPQLTTLRVVRSSSARWYVANLDITHLKPECRRSQS
jgi:hypothetical protein